VPSKALNPYTRAEMGKKFPKLKRGSLFIDYQYNVEKTDW
jgi:hypothetical protein